MFPELKITVRVDKNLQFDKLKDRILCVIDLTSEVVCKVLTESVCWYVWRLCKIGAGLKNSVLVFIHCDEI